MTIRDDGYRAHCDTKGCTTTGPKRVLGSYAETAALAAGWAAVVIDGCRNGKHLCPKCVKAVHADPS